MWRGDYLSDVEKQLREARKAKIFDMWLACHTSEEIAEVVGISPRSVENQIEETAKTEDLPTLRKVLAEFSDPEFVPPLYNVWTFYEVGDALQAIRDQRLYRATHGTFEDYCQQRWQMPRRYANRLILAANVMDNLGPVGPKSDSESQVRPLTALPADQQVEAWQQILDKPIGSMLCYMRIVCDR